METRIVNAVMEQLEFLALYQCTTILENYLAISIKLSRLIPDSNPSYYPTGMHLFVYKKNMFLNIYNSISCNSPKQTTTQLNSQ